MVSIDLSQFHLLLIALLPGLVSLLAGLIRQDKLPPLLNEAISYGVVLLISVMQALFDGKLGGSPLADFAIVAAYTQAGLHSPLLQQFQTKVQSATSIGGKNPQPTLPPALNFNLSDLQGLASVIAPALAQELAKIKLPASPQPQRQQQAVQQPLQPVYMPQNPNVAAQNQTLSSGSYGQQIPPAGQAFDLQSMQTRQMPIPGQYGQSG